jgi:hypothetical protein
VHTPFSRRPFTVGFVKIGIGVVIGR